MRVFLLPPYLSFSKRSSVNRNRRYLARKNKFFCNDTKLKAFSLTATVTLKMHCSKHKKPQPTPDRLLVLFYSYRILEVKKDHKI